VEAVTVRLLPFELADGTHNMAADEAMLQSAGQGVCSLRFYGWSEPTVSLGYFQTEAVRSHNPLLQDLPYVRRPSGGALLVHHHELTYALSLPAAAAKRGGPVWLRRTHEIIAAALRQLGVPVSVHELAGPAELSGFLCFQHLVAGDLMLGPAKVVGSSQRREHGSLLQHGAILLAMSPHTPGLPGIWELTGKQLRPEVLGEVIWRAFRHQTAWSLEKGTWTETERQAITELAENKYSQASWNARR
jgi:lipoate-protein ligase A